MKYLHSLAATVFFGALGCEALAQDVVPAAGEASSLRAESPENDAQKFILKTDGRIISGYVSERKGGGYSIRQNLGTIGLDTDDVEGVFTSMKAIYEYKREHLPPRDIQERMRLYRWCITYQLPEQAREQLQAILALSPDHEEAKTNLARLEISMARQNSQKDDQLVRTSATKPKDDQLRELDPAFLNRAMREMASRNTPVIFDLPEAQAVKRGYEFKIIIHPLLQRYCAGCHNERTPNKFPLVSASRTSSNDPVLVRANLDTTLKLVDQNNLMQSPLLVNSLLPHKPNNKPIFPGPNDPAYRIFANWISQLQSPANNRAGRFDPREPYAHVPQETSQIGYGQPVPRSMEHGAGSGFASEGRLRPESSNLPDLPIEANPEVMNAPRGRMPGQGFETAEPAMPGRLLPGSYNGASTLPPKDTSFPLPLPAGASPDELLKTLQAEEAARDARIAAATAKVAAESGDRPTETKTDQEPEPEPKPKKPVKIDQKLLDKLILQRRPGG
jgi:hypothetical protein